MNKILVIISGILLIIIGVYFIWQSILIGFLSGFIIIAIGGSFGAGIIIILGLLILKKAILMHIKYKI